MGFKFNTIPTTIAGCLTNFRFYRELVRRPLREAFIYLAILVTLPVLFFSGRYIYELNKIMVQITDALKGNLPPLRIEKGVVIMDGETFRFEKENEYTVRDWKAIITFFAYPSGRETSLAVRKNEQGKTLTPEEKELVAAVEATVQRAERAQAWVDTHFPDENALLTSQEVDDALEGSAMEDATTVQLLKETAHFYNFVFLVDLSTDEPRLPPGVMGFALGKNSYTINTPLMPKKITFSEETSTVINDDMLDSWRKSFIWQMTPILVLLAFLVSYLTVLILILGGSAISGLTASLLKHPLRFRQVFAIGVYAITPALLFILLSLLLALLKINLNYSLWIFLLLYGAYLVSATNKCCSTD